MLSPKMRRPRSGLNNTKRQLHPFSFAGKDATARKVKGNPYVKYVITYGFSLQGKNLK